MTNQIKVIIADDHEVFRDGLRMMLAKTPGISVVEEAANGLQAVNAVKNYNPDVVLIDIVMPLMDGIVATRRILEMFPLTGVIALSMFDNEHYIAEMLEAGALGYLLKNADKPEIIDAINTVYAHHPYYCRHTSTKLAGIIAKSRFNPYQNKTIPIFSDKEKEIIKLICAENTNKEIADVLYLSIRTVEGYRARILEKMNVKSTAGIVVYAIKTGLYKP